MNGKVSRHAAAVGRTVPLDLRLRVARTYDQRVRFRDLSRARRGDRRPRSSVLCFYSSHDNIGNYLPNLAMHRMLDTELDYWCMYETHIDFDWVNESYDYVVVGGAGLLYRSFSRFWQLLARHCELPIVLWGIGACAPYGEEDPFVDPEIVRSLRDRVALADVRDEWTAETYGLGEASIAPCPSIVWLRDRKAAAPPARTAVVVEPPGSPAGVAAEVRSTGAFDSVVETDNVQHPRLGLERIVDRYRRSSCVVTTRLHGAIIAYGLGLPYVALPQDRKLDEFHATFGNGTLVGGVDELRDAVTRTVPPEAPARFDLCEEFGAKVRRLIGAAPGSARARDREPLAESPVAD